MIKKKHAFISYLSIALALVCIILVWVVDAEQDALQAVFVVLVFLCLAFSRIYKARTISCPYCHAGRNFRGSMYFFYCENAIIKGKR